MTRSTRPAAEEVAEGALVEVMPAEVYPAQEAPSSALRRRKTRSPVLRTKTLTCLPVRARVTPEGWTSVPAARTGTVDVGAIRTMRSLVPFGRREPQGAVRALHQGADAPEPLGLGERGGRDDAARSGGRVHSHRRMPWSLSRATARAPRQAPSAGR